MKIAIIYHSITGNTEFVVKHLEENLKQEHDVKSFNLKKKINVEYLNDYEMVICCSWINKSTAAKPVAEIIEMLKDKKVYLVGTIGLYPRSIYGIKVKTNMLSLVDKSNKILGITLVNGKISKSIKMFFRISKFIPHMPADHTLTPQNKIFYKTLEKHTNINDANEVLFNIKNSI